MAVATDSSVEHGTVYSKEASYATFQEFLKGVGGSEEGLQFLCQIKAVCIVFCCVKHTFNPLYSPSLSPLISDRLSVVQDTRCV